MNHWAELVSNSNISLASLCFWYGLMGMGTHGYAVMDELSSLIDVYG